MGPVSFVIAIMGCADGASTCQQVAIAPARYESAAACTAATASVLSDSTDFDFPTLVARCQAAKARATERGLPVRAPGQRVKEG